MSEKRSFFISRAGPDERWADVIASVIRDVGHEAVDEEDFRIECSVIESIRAALAGVPRARSGITLPRGRTAAFPRGRLAR